MKIKLCSSFKIIIIAVLFGLFFWIVDALIHYFEFSNQLKMMIVEKPLSFADSLILNVYPHQLMVRLIFLIACIIGAIIVIIFLSRQKVMEKELVESEEYFRSVTERANDGIGVIYNGRLEYANPGLSLIAGYSIDEMIGQPFSKFIADSEVENVKKRYEDRIGNKEVQSVYETIVKHKNGADIYVEINAGLIQRKDRTVDLFFLRDITFRKLAQKALVENEEKYRTLITNIHAGLYRISSDDEGSFIEMNPAFISMFGYKNRDEVFAYNVTNLFAHERDRKDVNTELLHNGFVGNKELLLKKKDGQKFWAKISAVLIKNDDGEPLYYDGLVEDITERKRAEELLKTTNKELRQLKKNLEIKVKEAVAELRDKDHLLIKQSRHASMGEMIGNIAHQWRQPLTAIAVLIQDIEEAYNYDELTPEYLKESIKTTMDQLKYMSRTIDDFRNFFKPNKLKEDFSANAVIMKTIDFVQKSFENNQIELIIDLKQECTIYGYPNEYSQVILNILNNAKDAIVEKGTKNARVNICLDNKNDKVRLLISDNAGHIPEDIIDKIFDPYFTTKQHQKGTGLGLYMAKTIIEKNMNGIIHVQNIEDGVKFTVEV